MSNSNNEVEKFKDELLKIHEKSYDHFERQLSYISGGALGLTFILIEKVFKDITNTSWKGILIASWVLLGLTLFVNLISHVYASSLHSKTIDELNSGAYNQSVAKKRNIKIHAVNLISISTLFIGILFFILYISHNIVEMNTTTKPGPKPDQTRGLPSSPPPKPSNIPRPQPGTGTPSSPPPPPRL